jgi:hypothetical protein
MYIGDVLHTEDDMIFDYTVIKIMETLYKLRYEDRGNDTGFSIKITI